MLLVCCKNSKCQQGLRSAWTQDCMGLWVHGGNHELLLAKCQQANKCIHLRKQFPVFYQLIGKHIGWSIPSFYPPRKSQHFHVNPWAQFSIPAHIITMGIDYKIMNQLTTWSDYLLHVLPQISWHDKELLYLSSNAVHLTLLPVYITSNCQLVASFSNQAYSALSQTEV